MLVSQFIQNLLFRVTCKRLGVCDGPKCGLLFTFIYFSIWLENDRSKRLLIGDDKMCLCGLTPMSPLTSLYLALHTVNSEKKLLLVRRCVCNGHSHQNGLIITYCAPECLQLVVQISAEDCSRKMKDIFLWKLDPDRESIGLLWPKALPKVRCR